MNVNYYSQNMYFWKKNWFLVRKNHRILQLAMDIASNNGPQSVVPGWAELATLENVLEMHILRSY